MDRTYSYVILVHAEMEAFVEDRCSTISSRAEHHWNQSSTITFTCRATLNAYIADKFLSDRDPKKGITLFNDVLLSRAAKARVTHNANDISKAIAAAFKHFRKSVHNNHGIGEKHLRKLLLSVGIRYADLDPIWFTTLAAFSDLRGFGAHRSLTAATQILHPTRAQNHAHQALSVMQNLDGLLTRLARR